MNTQLNSKRGFTLIEVILVLAIAALIFLMIFVALPALQANQRDTARRNDAGLVSSAVTRYTSGERESILDGYTADGASILEDYIDTLDQYDAQNVEVSVATSGAGTASATFDDPASNEIFVYPQAECDGSSAAGVASERKNAVRIMLDNETSFYCVDAS